MSTDPMERVKAKLRQRVLDLMAKALKPGETVDPETGEIKVNQAPPSETAAQPKAVA